MKLGRLKGGQAKGAIGCVGSATQGGQNGNALPLRAPRLIEPNPGERAIPAETELDV